MIKKLPCHDEIVYEIQRAVQTFGPLTAQSLMKRCAQVAAANECEFSEEYFNFTCAEMQKRRLLTRSKSGAIVSLDGELQKKRDKQDAFWVLMEFADGISFDEIIDGPSPAIITFFKNANIYHLIPATSDGLSESAAAKQLEQDTESIRNDFSEGVVLEKLIFIVSQSFRKDIARKELKGDILLAQVAYGADFIPQLFFEKL